jgi:hypothetical protein
VASPPPHYRSARDTIRARRNSLTMPAQNLLFGRSMRCQITDKIIAHIGGYRAQVVDQRRS